MQKLRFFFIGFGFFWLFLWSILGSLIGVKLNRIALSAGPALDQIDPWQKKLLTQAHSHMNMMGITMILIGMTLGLLRGMIANKYIKTVCFVHLFSVALFGFGLVAEAFYPSEMGHISWAVGVTTLGGCGYMLTMMIWACFFFSFSLKQKS